MTDTFGTEGTPLCGANRMNTADNGSPNVISLLPPPSQQPISDSMRRPRALALVGLGLFLFLCYTFLSSSDSDRGSSHSSDVRPMRYMESHSPLEPISHGNVTANSPFIFIGGVPRSGTTLMRAMLDSHPDVRCGEETRVIPRILGLRSQWKRSEKEWNRLMQAGVTSDVINSAVGSFIIQIIAGHGAPAPRLCNKDPFTMKSAVYLNELFPQAKFIFMIRDGRATVHSIISRKVTITGFDLTNFRQCMTKWNAAITIMNEQCQLAGDKCLKVYYEQLVLHPETQMRRILEHLDLPWNPTVLHHEQHIGKDISLSNVERSSDQVVKPVNVDALSKWVGTISDDDLKDMDEIAPMLRTLGYDPMANPPNYGTPDELVAKKTEDVHKNGQQWYQKAVQVVNDPARVDKPATS